MYAVDDLSDAIDVTKEFLTPIRLGMWLKLALIVLFVGGASFGAPTAPFDGGATVDEPTDGPTFDEALEEVGLEMGEFIVGLVIVAAILLLLWLGFAAIAAILDFVFIESLRSSEVHVRRYANENVGKGLRLLLFRIGIGLLFGVPLAVVIGLTALTGPSDAALLSAILLVVLIAFGLGLVYVIVNRFTTVFVAPIMLLEGRGVIDAWRRFWPTFTGNWKEYTVYLVLIWIIQLVVGIAFAFLAAIVGVVLLIPFGLVAAVLFFALGEIGVVLAVLTMIVAALVVFIAIMLLRVPIYSYYRYYALLVLGDTNAELDLIPEQRAAVRGDGGVSAADETRRGGGWDDSSDERDDDGWNGRDDDGWDDSSSWDEGDDGDDGEDDRGW